ncbi:hypothetical protein SRHO_G00032960 [Serrasalmus rhombeus]
MKKVLTINNTTKYLTVCEDGSEVNKEKLGDDGTTSFSPHCWETAEAQPTASGMARVLLMGLFSVDVLLKPNLTGGLNKIQKNCLLALCSDHILQTVPFNRYEAAKQVMTCLSLYEDQTLQRMSVAVVSLLVSKLSVEEIGHLGAEEFIIKVRAQHPHHHV